jgi:hypothetical protein
LPALPNNPKLQAYKPSSAARLAGFPDLDFFFAGGLFFAIFGIRAYQLG